MANYGKYYIATRLLLLKQYLETNAGRNRYVERSELEDFLAEHDMPVEKKPCMRILPHWEISAASNWNMPPTKRATAS